MRMRYSLLVALLCPIAAQAAITNVRVLGVTPTQAVIAYDAPDASACTIEVSESPSYSPLAHDVDPALFPGANSDSRPGNLNDGLSRVFVIGRRTSQFGPDNKYYSRALQAYTTHYYRITCGVDTFTEKFSTANLMPTSYGDPFPVDPAHPGNWAWPTMDWWSGESDVVAGVTGTVTTSGSNATFSAGHGLVANDVFRLTNGWLAGEEMQLTTFTSTNVAGMYRPLYQNLTSGTTCPAPGCSWVKVARGRGNATQTVIDPLTGLWIRRLSAPIQGFGNQMPGLAAASGTNWTATGGAATLVAALGTASDGKTAEWAGDGASGPGDWLNVSTAVPGNSNSVDALRVVFNGSCSGGCTGSDALVDVCIADSSRAACRSAILSFDVTQAACASSAGCNVGDQYRVLKSWLSPTNPLGTLLSGADLAANGVLVRKRTRTSGLTLDIDKIVVYVSVHPGTAWFTGGYMSICSPQMAPQTYGGVTRQGNVCYTPDYRLYWIEPQSGDAALITNLYGADWSTGQNLWFNIGYQSGVFDPLDPAVWYQVVPYTKGGSGILKLTYTGDYLDVGPTDNNIRRFNYDISAQILTAGTTLQSMVQAYTAGQSVVFDPTMYSCGLTGWADNYLKILCYPSDDGQNSLQWIVMFDPVAQAIVAASFTHTVFPMRYGALHSVYADQAFGGWILLNNNSLSGGTQNGAGLLQTELNEILKAPGPVGVDPHDVACPALPWGFTSGGGTNHCSRVQVTGDIHDITPGSHENSLRGSAGFIGPLQAAAPGDIFAVDSERVQLLAKASCAPTDPCQWTLLRAVQATNSAQHAAGAVVFGLSQSPGSTSAKLFWNYLADPHGMNPTGAEIIFAPQGSHPNATLGQLFFGNSELGGAWNGKNCPTAVPSCWVAHIGTVPQMSAGTDAEIYVADSARFANQPVQGTGYADSHLSHLSLTPWILDGRPADTNVNGTQVWTRQASTLYKATVGITSIKSLPLEGLCSKNLLVDVSPGPIDASAAGAYTMCVGSSCLAGAGASDIYANCPDLTAASVTCSAWTNLCVYSTSSNLHMYQQADMTRNDPFGTRVRNLGNLLSRDGLDSFKNMKPLGSRWGMYRIVNGDGVHDEMGLVKLPPMTFDNVNRTTFVPVQVQLASVPAGTDNVVVEFGYDTNFYCTTRREACEAVSATVNETTPFYWASETYSGVRSPWKIAIPAISQRVLYYRVKYRNAGNAVIQTGPPQVQVVQ